MNSRAHASRVRHRGNNFEARYRFLVFSDPIVRVRARFLQQRKLLRSDAANAARCRAKFSATPFNIA